MISRAKIAILCIFIISISFPINVLSVKSIGENEIISPEGAGPYEVGTKRISSIPKTATPDKSLDYRSYNLPIHISYPIQTDSEATFPVIIFSGGVLVQTSKYINFIKRIASWGFIVVIAASETSAFPYERASDMIDAINWLEEQMKNSTFLLSETIDFSRLGMMGYSTGAAGSILAGNDTRIKAVVLISPEVEPYVPDRRVTAEDAAGIHVPVLQLCGTEDVHVRVAQPDIYAELNPPKYFIWVSEEDHWSIKWARPHTKYLISFLKYYLCEEPEYAKFLYGSPAQQDIDEGKIELYFEITEGAAVFELDSLTINPSSIRVGDTITVSIDCRNEGNKAGSHTVTLIIDGEVEGEKTVTLNPDGSTSVSFEVSTSEEGVYSVDVNGLSGSFEVKKAQTGIPGFPLESIVISVVLAVLVLWLIQRQR